MRQRLRARLGSADDASEMVHDAFARLLGAGARADLREPEAFLNRIVRNLLIDRSRRRSSRGPDLPLEHAPEPWIPPEQESSLEMEQLRIRYRGIVEALPERMRQVFLLHRVDGLSYREIGDRLGISPRTAEWHVGEAIVRIGKGLEGE